MTERRGTALPTYVHVIHLLGTIVRTISDLIGISTRIPITYEWRRPKTVQVKTAGVPQELEITSKFVLGALANIFAGQWPQRRGAIGPMTTSRCTLPSLVGEHHFDWLVALGGDSETASNCHAIRTYANHGSTWGTA